VNLDILIVLLTMLAAANYRFRRSVLYPPFLFCGMWLFDVLFYRFDLIDINQLHSITLFVIAGGALLFSLGGIFAYCVPGRFVKAHFTLGGEPRSTGNSLRYLIVFSIAICVCLSIRASIISAAGAGGIDGVFFMVAREVAIEKMNAGQQAITWYSYVGTWTIFVSALFLSERNDWLSWTATAMAFISCATSGARGGFLLLFSALTCVYLVRSKREGFATAVRFAKWPVLSFVFLFASLFFVDKNIQVSDNNALAFAGNSVVEYIVGPAAALDHVLLHLHDYANSPNHTFQFFLRIGSSFGLVSYAPPPTNDRFIFIPFGTNVYTAYKFLVTDFGIGMALVSVCAIGFLQCLLFRKAHTGSILGLYMYSISVYSVIMVIFDDAYSRFGFFLDAFVFAVVYLSIRSFPWRIFRFKPVEEEAL